MWQCSQMLNVISAVSVLMLCPLVFCSMKSGGER